MLAKVHTAAVVGLEGATGPVEVDTVLRLSYVSIARLTHSLEIRECLLVLGIPRHKGGKMGLQEARLP
jgi:hypothetical protein